MLRTRVEEGYRIIIPEPLRASLQEGEELLVSVDQAGRILMIPASKALEILERTAGLWRDRTDFPTDSISYVDQMRSGRRLRDMGVPADDGN